MIRLKEFQLEHLNLNSNCTTCGGKFTFNDVFCQYCGRKLTELKDLKEQVTKLEIVLQQNLENDIPLTSETVVYLSELYQLSKKLNSEVLTEFLKKQKVKEKLDTFIQNTNHQILNNQKLSEEENDIYLNLLSKNLLTEQQILTDYILKSVFLNHPLVDKEVFLEIVKHFVVTNLKLYNRNRLPNYQPECFIQNLNKKNKTTDSPYQMGTAISYQYVYLDTEEMINVYEGMVLKFQTVFHEMYHIADEIDCSTGIFSPDILKHIQEQVIIEIESQTDFSSLTLPLESRYYHRNYNLISCEKDAEINGYLYFLKYLNTLGLTFNNLPFIQTKINEQLALKEESLRNISFSSSPLTVTEIFEHYIKDQPFYLQKYPQLTVEYLYEDGEVRHKTYSEMVSTLSNTNSPPVKEYLKNWLSNHNQPLVKTKTYLIKN